MANPYTLCFRIALLEVDATTVQVVFRDRNDGGRGQCPPLRMQYGLTCLTIVASVKPVGVCSNPTLVDWRNCALIRVSYVSPTCDELLRLSVPGRPQTSTDDWRMSVLGKDIDIRSCRGLRKFGICGSFILNSTILATTFLATILKEVSPLSSRLLQSCMQYLPATSWYVHPFLISVHIPQNKEEDSLKVWAGGEPVEIGRKHPNSRVTLLPMLLLPASALETTRFRISFVTKREDEAVVPKFSPTRRRLLPVQQ